MSITEEANFPRSTCLQLQIARDLARASRPVPAVTSIGGCALCHRSIAIETVAGAPPRPLCAYLAHPCTAGRHAASAQGGSAPHQSSSHQTDRRMLS